MAKKTMRKDSFGNTKKVKSLEMNIRITKPKEIRGKRDGKSKMSKAKCSKQLQDHQSIQDTSLEKEYNGGPCLTQNCTSGIHNKTKGKTSTSQETRLGKCSLSTDSLKTQSPSLGSKQKSIKKKEGCVNRTKETAKALAKRTFKGNVKNLRCKLKPQSSGELNTGSNIKSILLDDKPYYTKDNNSPACGKFNGMSPQTLNDNSADLQNDGSQKHSRIYSTNKQSLAFSKPPNGSSLRKGKERLFTTLVSEKLNRRKKPKSS